MKNEIDLTTARQICAGEQIEIKALQVITGSFGKQIFILNQEFLLRVSETPMQLEQERFRRVAALDFVPKILQTGALAREAGPLYYTLLTLLPGDDFVNAYPETSEAQQARFGVAVAGFLDKLQEIGGNHYDVGLYVPALPAFPGTWREGHQKYWEILQLAAEKLPLQPESFRVLARAFQFLAGSAPALDFQSGPKLLHNDFHPKNLLLDRGQFSGVIDWECSQFGEADFELCHLIHWCLYPPAPTLDFRPFLRAFFAAAPRCAQVPNLAQRLTIYQVEHEIQQIIWNAAQAEAWRVPRLIRWLEGAAAALLTEVKSGG